MKYLIVAGAVLSPAHGKLEWSQAQALAIYHSQSWEKEKYLLFFLILNFYLKHPTPLYCPDWRESQQRETCAIILKNYRVRDFPGGAVVKNPPANAGDTGSSPSPGRSHVLRSN